MSMAIAIVQLGLDILRGVVSVVRWVMRGKRTASGRGGSSESVGGGGRGDGDPRVVLEPGDSLKAMLRGGGLPPSRAGALLRTKVRFLLAAEPEPDIDEILTLATAAQMGVRRRAR